MRIVPLLLALSALPSSGLHAQTASTAPPASVAPSKVLNLYPGAAPGALGSAPADKPTIDVYLPSV